MNDIDREIIKTSLQKMFNDTYFNICAIDKCAKVGNIIIDKDTYNRLSSLHCVP